MDVRSAQPGLSTAAEADRTSTSATRPTIPSIALVGLLALLLRVPGVGRDLPYVFDGDECQFVRAAMSVATSSLDPDWYQIPASTLIYPLAVAYVIEFHAGKALGHWSDLPSFQRAVEANPGLTYIPGRLGSALMGVLVVFATLFLAWEIGLDRSTCLFAALLVCLSRTHWMVGRLVRPDMLLTLMCLLATVCALRAIRGSDRWLVVAGAAAGLATASKWPGFLAFVGVPAAIVARDKRAGIDQRIVWTERATAPRRLSIALLLLASVVGIVAWRWKATFVPVSGLHAVRPDFIDGQVFLKKNLVGFALLLGVLGIASLRRPPFAFWLNGVILSRGFVLAGAAAAVAFSVVSPFILLRLEKVVQGLSLVAASHTLTGRGEPGLGNLVWYVSGPLARDVGPLGFILGLAGFVAYGRAAGWTSLPVILFHGAYLTYFVLAPLRWERYIIPIVPGFAVCTAYGLSVLKRSCGPRCWAAWILGAVLLAWPCVEIVRLQVELARPDTRLLASRWFEANVPKGVSVAIENHSIEVCAHCYRVSRPGGLFALLSPSAADRPWPDLVVSSQIVLDYYRKDGRRFTDENARYDAVLDRYREVVRFGPDDEARGPEIRVFARVGSGRLR